MKCVHEGCTHDVHGMCPMIVCYVCMLWALAFLCRSVCSENTLCVDANSVWPDPLPATNDVSDCSDCSSGEGPVWKLFHVLCLLPLCPPSFPLPCGCRLTVPASINKFYNCCRVWKRTVMLCLWEAGVMLCECCEWRVV